MYSNNVNLKMFFLGKKIVKVNSVISLALDLNVNELNILAVILNIVISTNTIKVTLHTCN